MRHVLKGLFLIFLSIGLSACGKKVTSKQKMPFPESEMSFLTIEKNCQIKKSEMEPVSKEISAFFYEYQRINSKFFTYVPLRVYDYKNPLIINLQDLRNKLNTIKNQIADAEYMKINREEVENSLFYLHQDVMRFEGSKCSFDHLVQKKRNDLRPYLNLNDFCLEKDGSTTCLPETIAKASVAEAEFIKNSTVNMCHSFDSSEVNCHAQYNSQKQDKSKLHSLVSYYQKRFNNERFMSLFKLRPSHLKFSCHRNESSVVMNLKVSSINHDMMALEDLVKHVEGTWSRKDIKIQIELVESKGSDVIEIIPSLGWISYVPDNNNRQIYLSTMLDQGTRKKVLAHEFGHVLGFPDCYSEFFDNKNKNLIYYEMGKENMNIMCSLKEGVGVPDDYFNQLLENSCVFN